MESPFDPTNATRLDQTVPCAFGHRPPNFARAENKIDWLEIDHTRTTHTHLLTLLAPPPKLSIRPRRLSPPQPVDHLFTYHQLTTRNIYKVFITVPWHYSTYPSTSKMLPPSYALSNFSTCTNPSHATLIILSDSKLMLLKLERKKLFVLNSNWCRLRLWRSEFTRHYCM